MSSPMTFNAAQAPEGEPVLMAGRKRILKEIKTLLQYLQEEEEEVTEGQGQGQEQEQEQAAAAAAPASASASTSTSNATENGDQGQGDDDEEAKIRAKAAARASISWSDHIWFAPHEDLNLARWHVQFLAPEDSLWSGVIFDLELRLPDQYPFHSPIIKMATSKMYHFVGGIEDGGAIITRLSSHVQNWSPRYCIGDFLRAAYEAVFEMNPDNIHFGNDKTEEFANNRSQFEANARARAAELKEDNFSLRDAFRSLLLDSFGGELDKKKKKGKKKTDISSSGANDVNEEATNAGEGGDGWTTVQSKKSKKKAKKIARAKCTVCGSLGHKAEDCATPPIGPSSFDSEEGAPASANGGGGGGGDGGSGGEDVSGAVASQPPAAAKPPAVVAKGAIPEKFKYGEALFPMCFMCSKRHDFGECEGLDEEGKQ